MYLGPNNPVALSGAYKQNARMSSARRMGLGKCGCSVNRLQTVDGISLGQVPTSVPVDPGAQPKPLLMTIAPLVFLLFLLKKKRK